MDTRAWLSTIWIVGGLAAILAAGDASQASDHVIPLSGRWSFRLDPQGVGERENWAAAALQESIQLPGSTAQAGFGDETGVDNMVSVDVGENAHSVSDHTQTNWNGIVGRIELRVTDRVFVKDIQVDPDVARKAARVQVTVGNCTAKPVEGALSLSAFSSYPDTSHMVRAREVLFRAEPGESKLEIEYVMGPDFRLWDEFSPNVYTLTVALRAGEYSDRKSADFGMRQMGVEAHCLRGAP